MNYADEFASLGTTDQKNSYADEFANLGTSKSKQEAKDKAYDPKNNLGSDYENFMAGAGKAIVDTGRGAKQLLDIPAKFLERKIDNGKLSKALGMPTAEESASNTQSDVDESNQLDKPLMNTGAGIAGNIAGNVASTLLPLGAASKAGLVGEGLVNPNTYKAAAGLGALQGAVEPTTGDESHVWNAGKGALLSLGGNAVLNAASRIAQPIKNALSSAQDKAVSILEDAGIPLDAAQKTGSSFLNKMRSSFSDNPFTSGANAELKSQQQSGFNRAALKTAGVDADAATPEVMGQAADNINKTFKNVLNNNNVSLNDSIVSRIAETQSRALEEEKTPISNIANRIMSSVKDGDTIPGQTAYGIKKDLDRLSSSADTTLAYHARQLRSTLMDAINDSLPEADKNAFSQARQQFSNLKKIENSIDKSGNGDISPSRLATVMSQKANRQVSIYGKGDRELVDLAHAGNMLLPDKAPNSGSVSRYAMQVGLPLLAGAGGGVYGGSDSEKFGFDLTDAAKTLAVAAAAPKMAQKAMNSPAVSNYIAKGMQGKLSSVRKLLEAPEENNTIGGMLRRLPESTRQAEQQ